MMDILKDIYSGALPVQELPEFIAWCLGKIIQAIRSQQ